MFNFIVEKKPQPHRANTYCMFRPKRLGGRLCQAEITIGSTHCSECFSEAFPPTICHVCQPPVAVPADKYHEHRKMHAIIAGMGK